MSALLVFPTTRAVVTAEATCRGADIPCRLVALPRHISAECGMAISLEDEHAGRAQEIVAAAGIPVALHHVEPPFDLLTTVETGGCSAKLPADQLAAALHGMQCQDDARLLVGADTRDDAGVVKLSEEVALIHTTDFFPPMCSDPYTFGRIAAVNAMSDVFAMGGTVLSAMNIAMFPAHGIPLTVLRDILRGGQDAVMAAGGIIVGGHTIADATPKYGLAVTGIVHPSRVITNACAKPGDMLILTKPIGTGTILAGHRMGIVGQERYAVALQLMQELNLRGAEIMQRFNVRCATDVTGFGLLGHALHIARASKVTLEIATAYVPLLAGAYDVAESGCIPGAAFNNLRYVEGECEFDAGIEYPSKMLTLDPQTSGGLLMSVAAALCGTVLDALRSSGYAASAVVGRAIPRGRTALVVR